MNITLSVIIVNYNVQYFLEQCLISVFKASKHIQIETIVVDNNSVDNSCQMVLEKFPNVILIQNKENVGFSKANNQAIHISKGKYILLLNPDTVVGEETFDTCIQFFENNAICGALGVKMIDGKGHFLPESKRGLPTPEVALYKMFGLNKLFPKSKKFGKYHLGYLPDDQNNEIDVIAGAFMMIRKTVLDKIGLLDEQFFMYGEDIDLSYRIQLGGYKNYYLADTSILHYKGESTKKTSVNYVKIFYQAMILFAKKHYSGARSNILVLLINTFVKLRASIALVQRIWQNIWVACLDIILMFTFLMYLKQYWEEHIKLITSYPKELVLYHFPYYIACWVGFNWFFASYKVPFSLKKIFQALLLSLCVILAIYGLLPESLRFSRAIPIIGTIGSLFIMIFTRMLYNFFKNGYFSFEKRGKANALIVGSEQSCIKLNQLVNNLDMQLHVVGYVNSEQDISDHKLYLGGMHQLEELVSIYKIKEILFSGNSVTSTTILGLMAKLGRYVNFKIMPQHADFIIGSNSKNTNGEFFTFDIKFKLNNPNVLYQKRLLDILLSILFLCFSLILWPFNYFKFNFFKNIFSVIWNQKTWVSYHMMDNKNVPKLQEGVLKNSLIKSADIHTLKNLDFQYALNYNPNLDLEIVLKQLHKLYL